MSYFFIAINFTKLHIILFLNSLREKCEPIDKELSIFYPKHCYRTKFSENSLRILIQDRFSRFSSGPGSRGPKGTGFRILIRNTKKDLERD